MDNLLSTATSTENAGAVDRRYVCTEAQLLQQKKSFFRPYANYFHGLSLLCMFAFTFRIREQEQILLNTM